MIQTIVVGTDMSASADLAVGAAADLARTHEASLLVLYVKPALDARDVFHPSRRPDSTRYLVELEERFSEIKVSTREVSGDPAAMICDVAEQEGADVIVVGSRGIHRRAQWLLGSVPQAVLQKAPCSVLVVDTRSEQ